MEQLQLPRLVLNQASQHRGLSTTVVPPNRNQTETTGNILERIYQWFCVIYKPNPIRHPLRTTKEAKDEDEDAAQQNDRRRRPVGL